MNELFCVLNRTWPGSRRLYCGMPSIWPDNRIPVEAGNRCMEFRTIFGPVLSGRLGRSLGLDLLGKKICTHDCLYCEVGPTITHTLRRAPYVPARTLLTELAQWKTFSNDVPDHITLGGSGEPCLNSELQEIIAGVKQLFPRTPVAVLTNSALIGRPDVRTALQQADVILPSMDTLDPQAFLRINRPHKSIALATMAQDLLDFRSAYAGKLFLEVLLLQGINDSQQELELLDAYCASLRPDRVDVGTLNRPGAHNSAPVPHGVVAEWRDRLNRHAASVCALSQQDQNEKFPPAPSPLQAVKTNGLAEAILHSVSRRAQSESQLAAALQASEAEIARLLASLLQEQRVVAIQQGTETFFKAAQEHGP